MHDGLMEFSEITQVKANWFYNDELYKYLPRPGTINFNKIHNTLRVTLFDRNRSPEDETEIVICQNNDASFSFKQSCTDDPTNIINLKSYFSHNEIILYYYNEHIDEIVYFHLS